MTSAKSMVLLGALILAILPSAASAQSLQTLIDACNAGDSLELACVGANASIPALPDNLTVECRWNGSNCSALVERNLSDVIAAFESNPVVENITFIQNGTQTTTVVVYAEPYQPFHEHVVLSDALFSAHPEMWIYLTTTNNLLTPTFNVSSLNPAELGVADLEEIATLLNNSGIDAGAGVVPDLAILKDVQNFTWNLSLPYNASRTLAGVMACNGSLENNSCTNATPAFDGTWYGLASCGTCGSCADNTYALDCPNSGWMTVYGADPMPVYTQEGALACGGTITNDTTLTGNLVCNGTALTINTTGATLDCAGYHIEGNGTGYGVNIVNASGVTVTKCALNNFSRGVYALRSNDTTISDNTVTNTFTGIILERSANATLTANSLYEYSTGINLYLLSTDATVTDNNLTGASGIGANIGISIDGASRSILRENRVSGHYGYGIIVGGSAQNVLVEDNIIQDNNYSTTTLGIFVTADTNNITGNTFTNNGVGISLSNYCQHNYVANNTVTGSTGNGINHFSGSENTVTRNTVESSQGYGIYVFEYVGGSDYSYDSTFTANRLCGNAAGDIVVNGTGDNNSGQSNTCDSTVNWADTGSAGNCTFTCDGQMTGCGHVYSSVTVSRNLTSNGTCATLIADDVSLDCAGHSLTGNYTSLGGRGIYADRVGDIAIENCLIQGYKDGINLDCGCAPGVYDNASISDCMLLNNTNYGLYLSDLGHSTVTGTIVRFNGDDGLHIVDAPWSQVSGATATNNSGHGIYVATSNHSTLTGNTASGNDLNGIIVTGSSTNLTVDGNTLNSNYNHGLQLLSNAHENTISANTATENGWSGIACNTDNNTISSNTASNNVFHGIHLVGHDNTVTGNALRDNQGQGIYVQGGERNAFSANHVWDSSLAGIYLDASADANTLASSNIFCGNTLIDVNNTGTSTTGSSNYCNTTYLYNDTNVTGCFYDCSQAIQTQLTPVYSGWNLIALAVIP